MSEELTDTEQQVVWQSLDFIASAVKRFRVGVAKVHPLAGFPRQDSGRGRGFVSPFEAILLDASAIISVIRDIEDRVKEGVIEAHVHNNLLPPSQRLDP